MPYDLFGNKDALHNKVDAMENDLAPEEEDDLIYDGPEAEDPFL